VALDREDEARAHKTRAFGVKPKWTDLGQGALAPGSKSLRELPTKRVFLPSYNPLSSTLREKVFEEVRRPVEGLWCTTR
jgi:hypothetical protein